MEEKINYQKILLKKLDEIKELKEKPTLLLHACCGCCLTVPLNELSPFFKVTIFYNNSNIYPEEEYHHRFSELKRYLKEIESDAEVVECDYQNKEFTDKLMPLKDEREGGARCSLCFTLRLEPGFKYAAEHHYDYFTTVMTISRFKNAQVINKLGLSLQEKYPTVKWLEADFKKNDGYQKSLQIVKEHNLYFQLYCGCMFSYEALLEREKNKG